VQTVGRFEALFRGVAMHHEYSGRWQAVFAGGRGGVKICQALLLFKKILIFAALFMN
jgi:hypothetical protein